MNKQFNADTQSIIESIRRIRNGDTVRAVFSDGEGDYTAIVLGTPAGAGDMWHLQRLDTNEVVALNPYNMYLECLTKEEDNARDNG